MGLLLGLDTLVSQAFGAGDLEDCHRWLVHGVAARASLLSLPMTLLLFALSAALGPMGPARRACSQLTRPYLDVLAWSMPAAAALFGVPPLSAGHGRRRGR